MSSPLLMAGGKIKFKTLLLGVDVGFRVINNALINYHLGCEFYQNHQLYYRLGTSHNSMFSAGIGLRFPAFHIDYAYIDPSYDTPFAVSHIISTGFFIEKINKLKGKIMP